MRVSRIIEYKPQVIGVDDYPTCLQNGLLTCKNYKIVIAGLIRDAEKRLPHLKYLIWSLGRLFKDFQVVFYENDSKDDTVAQLDQWEKTKCISEQLRVPSFGSVFTLKRMEFMVQCRNRYLEYIDNNIQDIDYVIVLDTDINDISINGVASSFGIPGWNCITSQGLDTVNDVIIYYDIAPLVIDGLIRNATALLPIPMVVLKVESAFGGLAIYKYSDIRGKRYHTGVMAGDKCDWHPDMRPMCDHIGLNLQLDNVLINPYQIVIR